MTQPALTIGLVGVGPWGALILRDLKKLGATVHACTRSDESQARAAKGGADTIVRRLADLPECDGYIIAVRTTSHLDAVEALLPRGKPIYSEKPLSSDIDRLRRLPPEAAGLVFTMHKWRYHPGIIELARIAGTQEFGPVQGLRTYRLGQENHHHDVAATWTLLPHDISIALHIFNEVPGFVASWGNPLAPHDSLLAYYRTSTGIPFIAEVSSSHATKWRNIVLACVADVGQGQVEVRGEVVKRGGHSVTA